MTTTEGQRLRTLGTFSCYMAHMGYGLGIGLGYAKGSSSVNHLRSEGSWCRFLWTNIFLQNGLKIFFIISAGGPNHVTPRWLMVNHLWESNGPRPCVNSLWIGLQKVACIVQLALLLCGFLESACAYCRRGSCVSLSVCLSLWTCSAKFQNGKCPAKISICSAKLKKFSGRLTWCKW